MNGEETTIPEEKKEDLPSKEASMLFGKAAIWIWLACLIMAIWFKFLPLIAVSIFLFLMTIMTLFWSKRSLENLQMTMLLSRSRVFCGEEFTAEASIRNNKWLPLVWLEWEFPQNNSVIWGESKRDAYLIRFLWLLWFQKVTWTLKGQAVKRGVYDIGQITVRSGDGFRFTEKEQVHSFNQHLYIYPKLLSVQAPAFRPSMQWQMKGKQGGFLEDPLLIKGIREYQPGDEWRRFNWKASARTGKMLTNVYQPVVTEQLMIVIDVFGFVIDHDAFNDNLVEKEKYINRKKEEFEWFLSGAASIAMAYRNQGIHLGYASNARSYAGKKQTVIEPSNLTTLLLDQLAEITQLTGARGTAVLDVMLLKGKKSIPFILFCKRITKEHYEWYEQHKHEAALICFYYMSASQYSEKLSAVSKKMDMLLTSSAG